MPRFDDGGQSLRNEKFQISVIIIISANFKKPFSPWYDKKISAFRMFDTPSSNLNGKVEIDYIFTDNPISLAATLKPFKLVSH